MHASPGVIDIDTDTETNIDIDTDNVSGLSAFLRMRPRLFGIAYRMLGSTAEAEDIVQDVWVRWQTSPASKFSLRRTSSVLPTAADGCALLVPIVGRLKARPHSASA